MSNVTTIVDLSGSAEIGVQSLVAPDEPFDVGSHAVRITVERRGEAIALELTATEAAHLLAALSQSLADAIR